MKIALFCHSIASCWNHGNAHFLRGVVRELLDLGHAVDVFEPRDSWSRDSLVREEGTAALAVFADHFPQIRPTQYEVDTFDPDTALDGVDLVLVHEWTSPEIVARLGERRRRRTDHVLLFHDTHHRAVTAPEQMAELDLAHYDGVLAFGEVLRELYLERGWARAAWTWHEAADHRLFRPHGDVAQEGDLVWIGNWGDDERSDELREFLLTPIRELGLRARIHGVRYSAAARREIAAAGATYCGWLPNIRVPLAFAAHAVTVHVPRRPYARALPGIPTIRVFEALSCGVPLVSAPWSDSEGLFAPGDIQFVNDGAAMIETLRDLLADPRAAAENAARGRQTILARHTCAHRAAELLDIAADLGVRDRVHPVAAQLQDG